MADEPSLPPWAVDIAADLRDTLAELWYSDDDDLYIQNIARFDFDDMNGVNYLAGVVVNAMIKRKLLECTECLQEFVGKTKRVFCECYCSTQVEESRFLHAKILGFKKSF
jgi:hypothetical protein